MPAWLEVLLNVIGYGGFIAVACIIAPPAKSCRSTTRARPAQ
jgi:hypothetical protein